MKKRKRKDRITPADPLARTLLPHEAFAEMRRLEDQRARDRPRFPKKKTGRD